MLANPGCQGWLKPQQRAQPPALDWNRGPTIFLATQPEEPNGLRLQWREYTGSLRQAMADFSILPASWNDHSRFGVFGPGDAPQGYYRVYVRNPDGVMKRIAERPPTARSYLDRGATPGRLRFYQVCRVDKEDRVVAVSAVQPGVLAKSLIRDLGFEGEFAGDIPPDTPVFGWGKAAGGEVAAEPDGRPGGASKIFLRLCPLSGHTGGGPVRVRLQSQRVPIRPGASYFQSGWVRAPNRNPMVYLGRVWLDENRRPLYASYMAVGVRCPHWTFFSQYLVPAPTEFDASDYRYQFGDRTYWIPSGARFCELSVMADVTREGADVDDMIFCEAQRPTRPAPAKKKGTQPKTKAQTSGARPAPRPGR